MDRSRRPLIEVDQFFEMSPDLLAVAGFDGYFKRVSRTWMSTFGWTEDEFLSRPSVEFVHPEDRELTLTARESVKGGVLLTGLVNRYLCKDGSVRWLEWRSVGNLDGELVYAVARDITQQREAEQEARRVQAQLIVAERMASIGRLAAGVAHEINNPLAYLLSNLRMVLEEHRRPIEQRTYPPEELEQMLQEALAGAQKVAIIVQRLQAFAGGNNERRSLIQLQPVVETSLTLVGAEVRRRAQLVEAYGECPLVDADPARLSQVLVNLLINSAQAIPEGAADTNQIRVTTSTDASGRAIIEVADTGVGIPQEVRAHIFDPFVSTRRGEAGAGLGLSICHAIISSMGGEIAVDSVEGRGTRLRVYLPPAADEPADEV